DTRGRGPAPRLLPERLLRGTDEYERLTPPSQLAIPERAPGAHHARGMRAALSLPPCRPDAGRAPEPRVPAPQPAGDGAGSRRVRRRGRADRPADSIRRDPDPSRR